jgi:hypothetical protein
MYAKLILRFQCYSVEFGMLCHLYVDLCRRSFLRSKLGRGAQRYVCVRGGPKQPLHRDPQWSIVLYEPRGKLL